jgi:hypothetical protein
MKLTLHTEDGQTATIELEPGENLWIDTDRGAYVGSLYLANDSETIGLGRFTSETQWWEFAEMIPTKPE